MSIYEPFKSFAEQVSSRAVELMLNRNLVPTTRGDISGVDAWEFYLESIPAEHNPIFRERRYHDGSYDRSFIRRFGHVLWIDADGNISTIWEVEGDSYLHEVAQALDLKLRSGSPRVYSLLLSQATFGSEPNYDDDGILYHHFVATTQGNIVSSRGPSTMSRINSKAEALTTRSSGKYVDALKSVLELIDGNMLYRGEQYRKMLAGWLEFAEGDGASAQRRALWKCSKSRIFDGVSGSAISALVQDVVDSVEIEDAVRRYEAMVAPANYRRATAIVTPAMIDRAVQELGDDGLGWLMNRKIATVSDIAHNFIFEAPTEGPALGLIDELKREAGSAIRDSGKLKPEMISLRDFAEELHGARSIEIAPGPGHSANRFALTCNEGDGDGDLAWGNGFGWTYLNSGTSDAVRERVKNAGGNVDAPVRISLAWSNSDDLDLHARSPEAYNGDIYFGNRRGFINGVNGHLDVDMNVGGENPVDPVENIYFDSADVMRLGIEVKVRNYTSRNAGPVGYEVHVVVGETTAVLRAKTNANGGFIVRMGGDGQLEFKGLSNLELAETTIGHKWVPVIGVSHSPNYWDDAFGTGQKHLMLLTEDFEIEAPVRTVFSEHLPADLHEHRKAINMIASRLVDEPKPGVQYARGYGFSNASGQSFIARVTEANGRKTVYKVTA